MKKLTLLFLLCVILFSCESDIRQSDNISDIDTEGNLVEEEKGVALGPLDDKKEEVVLKKKFGTKIIKAIQGEELLNKNIKAPDLLGLTNWMNGEEIKSLEELKGKVVFVDFWTYSCINCIRTLGHMQELHEKYGGDGLVILGIHAPEFAYERKLENLEKEVKKYGLTYIIAQDNDFATWKNYKNKYWPAQYIINKQGIIKYVHYGEGAYDQMDSVVEFLLSE